MSVSIEGNVIVVAGRSGVEEAETLVALIESHPGVVVDISQAGAVHTALWQVLMALHPQVTGAPQDAFTRTWLMPVLNRTAG